MPKSMIVIVEKIFSLNGLTLKEATAICSGNATVSVDSMVRLVGDSTVSSSEDVVSGFTGIGLGLIKGVCRKQVEYKISAGLTWVHIRA